MTVQDIFFITGRGLVATGKIEQGSVRVGEDVMLKKAIEVLSATKDTASAKPAAPKQRALRSSVEDRQAYASPAA